MPRTLVFAVACLLAVVAFAAAAPPDHSHMAMPAPPSFGKLDGLVGQWQALMPDGQVATASFERVAGGTVLMERQQMGQGAADGDDVRARRQGDRPHPLLLARQPAAHDGA
jgi:hypothetical protein